MKRSHVAWNYMWADPNEEDRTFELQTEPIGQITQPVDPIKPPQANTDIGAVQRMTPEQEKKTTIQGQVEAQMEKELETENEL